MYNSENYISRAIESVQKQTFRNIEILVINDGSKDSSLQIIQSLAQYDDRIKVFNQKNSGVSKARNLGIEKAQGKYIAFLDSDDYVDENMYLELFTHMCENNCDLVSCHFAQVNNLGEEKIPQLGFSKKLYNYFEIQDYMYLNLVARDDLSNNFPDNLWTKLYSKKIIIDNNIRFDEELKVGEDLLFVTEYFLNIESFYHLPHNTYYKYYKNENSVINSYIKNLWEQSKLWNRKIKELENKYTINFGKQIDYHLLKMAMSSISNEGKRSKRLNKEGQKRIIRQIVNDDDIQRILQTIDISNLPKSKKLVFKLMKMKATNALLYSAALRNKMLNN